MSERELYERALAVTPGASQTRSKAPGNVGPADATRPFPLFARTGTGECYVEGVDGSLYLDLFGANAAIPLGYGFEPVAEAVAKAVRTGSLLSLAAEDEVITSELFLSMCARWAQQVRWVRTGSEAVTAAVRLARIATGRSRLVAFDHSYHGWHDFTYARFRDPHPRGTMVYQNGVPAALGHTIALAPYGDESYKKLVGPDTAALLFEAHRFERTSREWLQRVVAHARASGAVVIFDEMVYGLRWALGGAAEFFGVQPDLACFGKALGNGVPIACVCGSRDLMEPAARFVSGTYGGDRIGLCAAQAVLRTYRERDVIEEIAASGRAFRVGYAEQAAALGVPADIGPVGYHPSHWRLAVGDALDAVLERAARYGLLVARSSNNASAAMPRSLAHTAGVRLADAVAKELADA